MKTGNTYKHAGSISWSCCLIYCRSHGNSAMYHVDSTVYVRARSRSVVEWPVMNSETTLIFSGTM